MNHQKLLAAIAIGAVFSVVGAGCSKTTTKNTNTVVTEAPYVVEGAKRVYSLQLVNGLLNYKTMTFHPGDSVEIRLTEAGQPVDFYFQEVTAAASTNGIFGTNINTDDPGGTYHLICKNRECGGITVTVPPGTKTITNATGATNQPVNTNTANGITKVELQRVPVGATFGPNNNYAITTTFVVGDQFGLNVNGKFNPTDLLTYGVNNSGGQQVIMPGPSSKLTGTSNGSCCFGLPATAGSYDLILYINGVQARSVPITMTAK